MRNPTFILAALTLLGCGDIGDPSGSGSEPTDRFGFTSSVRTDEGPRNPLADDTPPDAPFVSGQRRAVEDADAAFIASSPNEFVQGVLMPGDLDGDGYGDLVLWSRLHNDADTVECEMGCPAFSQLVVHIAYGGPDFPAGSRIRPDARVTGWHVNSLLSRVASAGDVDGDGLADLLVSISGDCQQGNVFELRGGPRLEGTVDIRDVSAMTRETGSCTGFGNATRVGDIDGDGLSDYAIAASVPGRTYLYYGREATSPGRRSEADADATLVGSAGSRLGLPEPAGDVDGDGFDDFLLAPPVTARLSEPRPWLLVHGGPRLEGETDIEARATRIAALSIRSVGDLDGDSRSELGVVRASPDETYILPGRSERSTEASVDDGGLRIRGVTTRDGGAGWFRPAGDLNNDGGRDFIYSAPAGALHVILSPISLTQPELDLDTSVTLLGRGWSDPEQGMIGDGVAAGSDLNGDGLDDLAFVAARGPYYGFVYLWLGRS